jgi:hypothetical protein
VGVERAFTESRTVSAHLHLDDIRRAWEARDPALVQLIATLANQDDEEPKQPIRDGALTFDGFVAEIHSQRFRRKKLEEQAHRRIELLKALEAPDAEVPLPERRRLYEILLVLWTDDSPLARTFFLRLIATVPLVYGPWRALKRIFKEAETRNDTEVYGALAARFDMELASGTTWTRQITPATLAYLCRRAWRFLRRTAQSLPVCYADFAADFLACYNGDTVWERTWIANHIIYHETKQYNRNRFTFRIVPEDVVKHRAFAELWQRTPRPLFALLERAQSDTVRHFAASALQTDFRAALREVEPAWVARLVNVGSKRLDEFVVWVLNNVPRFEQAAFRSLGLHDAVLRLFDSLSETASSYAASYARTHARDLPVAELIRLANSPHEAVRTLAADLLQERDPRRDIGLEAWGQLLETERGHKLAATLLRKHFGPSELTPAWFQARLFTSNKEAFKFVRKLLHELHPPEKLGAGFFIELVDRIDDVESEPAGRVAKFALGELVRFDLNALDADFRRRLFLNPLTREQTLAWVNEGRLKANALPSTFFKALAYHLEWESDAWLTQVRAGPRSWMRQLKFDEGLADTILTWLGDGRRFTPAEIGFDWLMQLVARSEPRYHDFAVETMIRCFKPGDFAGIQTPVAHAPGSPRTVNFNGALFLFTGKFTKLKREQAESLVKDAGGVVAVGVSTKLHYLVVGDRDSPLHGEGPKRPKHEKAEELNASGANIRIITEAAFIEMTRGPGAAPSDATLAGCERLWQMAIAPGPADAPVARFAVRYLRLHHPDIGQAELQAPVPAASQVPAAFLSFDRIEPLFFESRKPLRDFALELATWEFARWNPPARGLLKLCEAQYPEVRQFVTKALLADDKAEHRRYRLDPEVLSPAAVYSFCESTDEATRQLGMVLIQKSPRLRVPEELFRLSESPDRTVRAFVVRTLWSLYRERGITLGWKPYLPAQPTLGAKAKKAAAQAAESRGSGAPPRPEHLPAEPPSLSAFLRRILFEIPPGRLQPKKAEEPEQEGIRARLKPLPARKAKLGLVEVMRDLAVEDGAFARGVLPLLQEFMGSRGKSEQAACLVAVTRIRAVHRVE